MVARRYASLLLSLIVSGTLVLEGPAIEVTLNIDPAQTMVRGDLYVLPVDAYAAAQDVDETSLTTSFSGTITVDVDDVTNPTSIKFLSANAVAANSGDWLPDANGGSEGTPVDGDADPGIAEPANYGWDLDLGIVGRALSASRNTVLNFKSTRRPVTSGEFDPLGISITSPQGTFDSNVSSTVFGDGADSDDVASEKGLNCTDIADASRCGGATGSYTVDGGMVTLTMPILFDLGAAHGIADFNADEEIDILDYLVWRETLGTSDAFVDVDNSGTVDQGDYEIWKVEFGEEVDDDDDFIATFAAGRPDPENMPFVFTPAMLVATFEIPQANSASIPEPATPTLILLATLCGLTLRRR